MEVNSAKSGAFSPRSGYTNKTNNSTTAAIHPATNEELRRLKPWLSKNELLILETEGKPVPNRVFDCLEAMILHHMAESDNHSTFIANHKIMTAAIDADVRMTKGELHNAMWKFFEFVDASVVMFAYGETRHTNPDGHWLVFAIDFSCDRVFVYDSCNLFKGAQGAFKKLIKMFIEPHLCYLRSNPGPLD